MGKRNLNNRSTWARNLIVKVRRELRLSSVSSGPLLDYALSTPSMWGERYHLDTYYSHLIEDGEQKEQLLNDYKRLMGSGIHNQVVTKYTGPLSHKEIEAIEDITKETK